VVRAWLSPPTKNKQQNTGHMYESMSRSKIYGNHVNADTTS